MTDEEKAMAQEMRDQGMFYREIGEALGLNWNTIRYNLDPAARQYDIDYRKEHKAEIRERKADRYKAYKEEYYKTHKEAVNRNSAEYRKLHEARVKQYQLKYRQEHKAEARQYGIDYYQAHKQEIAKYVRDHSLEHNACVAKRRALIRGTLDNATPEQLAEIVELYRKAREDPKVRCYICGDLIPMGEREVDHIYPASKGGSSLPSNLAVAHARCNREKHTKLPEEIGILI